MELASKLDKFYPTQHKLQPNQKKKLKYIEKKRVQTEEMAIWKNCSQKNSQWRS